MKYAVLLGLLLAGCAHEPSRGGAGTAALLGADHSFLTGDLYGSHTDETALPDRRGERLERLYEDEEPQAVAVGSVVRWSDVGGERTDTHVALSRDLPAGSVVRVTRLDDGRSVIVEVRGREPLPFGLLALSDDVGRELGLEERGELTARVEVLARPEVATR